MICLILISWLLTDELILRDITPKRNQTSVTSFTTKLSNRIPQKGRSNVPQRTAAAERSKYHVWCSWRIPVLSWQEISWQIRHCFLWKTSDRPRWQPWSSPRWARAWIPRWVWLRRVAHLLPAKWQNVNPILHNFEIPLLYNITWWNNYVVCRLSVSQISKESSVLQASFPNGLVLSRSRKFNMEFMTGSMN